MLLDSTPGTHKNIKAKQRILVGMRSWGFAAMLTRPRVLTPFSIYEMHGDST